MTEVVTGLCGLFFVTIFGLLGQVFLFICGLTDQIFINGGSNRYKPWTETY